MAPPKISVTGKLRHARTIQVDDFRFVAEHTDLTPKVAIPSPTMVHFRGGRGGIDIESYPDLDEFFDDLAQCYRDEIGALYAAGCRYIQLDDTNLAYLCDPVHAPRCGRPRRRPRRTAAHVRRADQPGARRAARRPHRRHPSLSRQLPQHPLRQRRATKPSPRCCSTRSTSTRTSSSTTTSDPATSRRCASSPTTRRSCSDSSPRRRPELEDKDLLRARIHEAAEYVDLDRMCLSPQCGFSSTIHGNEITEDDQWAKLRHVVEVADSVWN